MDKYFTDGRAIIYENPALKCTLPEQIAIP